MDFKTMQRKFAYCNITLEADQGAYRFQAKKKNQLLYYLMLLLGGLTAAIVFIFVGLSLIGIVTLAAALSIILAGVKAIKESSLFNNGHIHIDATAIRYPEGEISMQSFVEFQSRRSSNPIFPNANIVVRQNNGGRPVVLRITRKNSKYLNDDRHELVKMLNELMDYLRNENRS